MNYEQFVPLSFSRNVQSKYMSKIVIKTATSREPSNLTASNAHTDFFFFKYAKPNSEIWAICLRTVHTQTFSVLSWAKITLLVYSYFYNSRANYIDEFSLAWLSGVSPEVRYWRYLVLGMFQTENSFTFTRFFEGFSNWSSEFYFFSKPERFW